MPNPMDNWKHRRKDPTFEPEKTITQLEREPVWDENRQLWKSVFVKTLADRRERIPKVKGHLFHWDGATYEAKGQAVITDTELLRELNYPHRHKKGVRAFVWVYLEQEDDDYLMIVMGLS